MQFKIYTTLVIIKTSLKIAGAPGSLKILTYFFNLVQIQIKIEDSYKICI